MSKSRFRVLLLSSHRFGQYLDKVDITIKEKIELLEAFAKEQQKVQREMDKIMQLHLDDQLRAEGFGKRYSPLETAPARLRKKSLPLK